MQVRALGGRYEQRGHGHARTGKATRTFAGHESDINSVRVRFARRADARRASGTTLSPPAPLLSRSLSLALSGLVLPRRARVRDRLG